ncbi:hypothetical protein BAX97_08525 [Elizabethkingia meningoseptica]|uniref:DUF3575 domain-containing protein n=1 Tax=Elizabethkingia meningoseptica TaxID=238 RepID=UPI000332D2C5|nr:DUF3575 domain-containing protein [Elizabethkingia meningoseptica]AQX06668.1 hypothetical protein BBD33_16020 [Elizabethkingia meningoseptica]AQX48716.1 hypothetical protein B5G46_16015 [Elizabethkingia meningoseptica]EJK5330095.1 DUF3575 domain-containing protein [Elizabethkingia meningoseptica]EOR28782.1 hypothetical protein L100_14625 [Elizabethkingia meningoseptica ATCC 13253 = NBRC 12535]KUY13822.1 hypothetical protein ATB99_13615 [Elizabethkingia meningoseptica]
MKKILTVFILAISFGVYAQEYKNQIKGNMLFAPIGILNVGYEHAFNQHWTGQADVLISPWKSFAGNHLQIYMGHVEARYYFTKAMEKWYVGANAGMGVFNLQKWNYWNTDVYQKGFNYMIGGTVGYQLKLSDRWNIDFYVGGGASQSFYHGWYKDRYPRERSDSARAWNKSGEFIPFRGGAMLSYKF